MKIPNGHTFPAFWLIGPSQINIYEGFQGEDGERKYSVGYTNEWTDQPGCPDQGVWMKKLGVDDLADNFHTYTGVWTPSAITYFLDGREIATFKSCGVDQLQWYGT